MTTLADAPVSMQTLYMLAMVAGATATIILYLEKKFSEHRKLAYSIERNFNRVISRHNHEDDDLFEQIHTEIWRLHLRNAAKDGASAPEFKPLPRRRYLVDDGEQMASG